MSLVLLLGSSFIVETSDVYCTSRFKGRPAGAFRYLLYNVDASVSTRDFVVSSCDAKTF